MRKLHFGEAYIEIPDNLWWPPSSPDSHPFLTIILHTCDIICFKFIMYTFRQQKKKKKKRQSNKWGGTTWISASILIKLYTLCSVFKIESCFHSLFLIKFSWKWNLNHFNRPKIFTSVFHLTPITCFLGLIWKWLVSNIYIFFICFTCTYQVSVFFFTLGARLRECLWEYHPEESPRASSPIYATTDLRYNLNYGASYYGPGAYLQEHYAPIFLNPSLLRTVYGITVTIYFALIVQTVSVFPSPTSIAMLTT